MDASNRLIGLDGLANFFQDFDADSGVDDRVGARTPSTKYASGIAEATCVETFNIHRRIVVQDDVLCVFCPRQAVIIINHCSIAPLCFDQRAKAFKRSPRVDRTL